MHCVWRGRHSLGGGDPGKILGGQTHAVMGVLLWTKSAATRTLLATAQQSKRRTTCPESERRSDPSCKCSGAGRFIRPGILRRLGHASGLRRTIDHRVADRGLEPALPTAAAQRAGEDLSARFGHRLAARVVQMRSPCAAAEAKSLTACAFGVLGAYATNGTPRASNR